MGCRVIEALKVGKSKQQGNFGMRVRRHKREVSDFFKQEANSSSAL